MSRLEGATERSASKKSWILGKETRRYSQNETKAKGVTVLTLPDEIELLKFDVEGGSSYLFLGRKGRLVLVGGTT
jgi:hypothetical protein